MHSVILLTFWAFTMASALDVEDFFPDVNQNLTKITWAHAVNDQSYLNDTLKTDVNMIEADIVLGKLNGDDQEQPIMGHPPQNTSDLSLSGFLLQVSEHNANLPENGTKKGVKLDFKSIEAFNASISIVAPFDNGTFPIWINADILTGPNNNETTPVNADQFLQQANNFSNSTLSIGWTTASTGAYNTTHITEMIDAITRNNVTQNITFPVRAVLAAESADNLVNLLNEVQNSTLTIWMSSEEDNVEVENLRLLIKTVGLNKTFIDVPESLMQKLQLDNLPNGVVHVTGAFWATCLVALIMGFRSI